MSISEGNLKEIITNAMKKELEERDGLKKLINERETHIDHVCGCPDCLCGAMDRLNKTSDYFCKDCGFPLGSEEFVKKLKDCPNCHRTNVRPRER